MNRLIMLFAALLLVTGCARVDLQNKQDTVKNSPTIKSLLVDKDNHYAVKRFTIDNRFIEKRKVGGSVYYATCRSSNAEMGCGTKKIISIEQMIVIQSKDGNISGYSRGLREGDITVRRIYAMGDSINFEVTVPLHYVEETRDYELVNAQPFRFHTTAVEHLNIE